MTDERAPDSSETVEVNEEEVTEEDDKHLANDDKDDLGSPVAIASYQEYLALLQERNRLLRKLKRKSKKQIALERREQGFSLYLNGANAESNKNLPTGVFRNGLHPGDTSHNPRKKAPVIKQKTCIHTVPRRVARKSWLAESVVIKTDNGQNVRIKAPKNKNVNRYLHASNESEDDECCSLGLTAGLEDHHNYPGEAIRLSLDDLKILRQRLQENESVQKSILEDPDESDQEVIEDLELCEPSHSASCNSPDSFNKSIPKYKKRSCLVQSNYPTLSARLTSKNRCWQKWQGYRKNNCLGSVSEWPQAVRKMAAARENTDEVFLLELESTPKRCSKHLPSTLSAVSEVSVEDDEISNDVLEAIKSENQRVQESVIKQQMQKHKSASDDTLNSIIQQVEQLEPRQHRHLLRTLAMLEVNTDDKSSSHPEQDIGLIPSLDSAQSELSKYSLDDFYVVCLEICSNWGHPDRVGLTEIQFLDHLGQLMEVKSENVNCHEAVRSKGQLSNMHNGKTKTVKERYMWSCALQLEPVKLVFALERSSDHQLTAIRIWNFNHSIKDLLIGARQVKIYVDHELEFDGVLDKGCGNQVFDYSQTIRLQRGNITSRDDLSGRTLTAADSKSCAEDTSFSTLLHNKKPMAATASPVATVDQINGVDVHEPSCPPMSGKEADIASPTQCGLLVDSLHSLTLTQMLAEERTASQNSMGIVSPSPATMPSRDPVIGMASNTTTLPESRCWTGRQKEQIVDQDGNYGLLPSKASSTWAPEASMSPKRTASSIMTNTPTSSAGWYSNPESPRRTHSSSTSSLHQSHITASETPGHAMPSAGNKPKWLEKSEKLDGGRQHSSYGSRPTWLKGIEVEMKEPFQNPPDSNSSSRCSSGSRVMSGRPRRYDSEPLLDLAGLDSSRCESRADSATRLKDVPLAADGEEGKLSREGSAKYGRRAMPSPTPSSGDPRRRQVAPSAELPFREESARTRTRRNMDRSLEESWTSLHMFNQHHMGRLSMSMHLEGDILDGYVVSDRALTNPTMECDEPEPDAASIGSSDSDFIIPELPEGREMVVNIRTTWGDCHYVGLNGIEIFSSTGDTVKVQKISANPADINILPEYSKDPRVVSNLIDGIHRTRDDMHLWLTPFTSGKDHLIFLSFERTVKVAMVRIWNYNKSRIHSFRGAKDVVISLEGKCIFKGEIARACGGIQGGIEAFGDTILFTTDDAILESIAKIDETFTSYMSVSSELIKDDTVLERPRTGYRLAEGERPLTSADLHHERRQSVIVWDEAPEEVRTEDGIIKGKCLELTILANWGDPCAVGLTGLEVMDEVGNALPLQDDMLHMKVNDALSNKTLCRLINGNNVATADSEMWVCPFSEGFDHSIVITFSCAVNMMGVRLWNYNDSLEESYRGVKLLRITIDGKLLSPIDGYLVRKGPGNCHFDFAQELLFSGPPVYSMVLPGVIRPNDRRIITPEYGSNDYESPVMPRGFVFQLQLYSTWGDSYYVGLNGLEFYDALGNVIPLADNNIAAYPDSVNVLDNVTDDVRTPDKLVDGVNDTVDGRHMWLAPILPCVLNRIYIIFDYPVTVSMIKLWNYSKTPGRGVKEFGLLVDDLLVYHNMLNQVKTVDSMKGSVPHHTILFTSDKAIIQKEQHAVLRNRDVDQDVQLTNDCQVLHRGASGKVVDQALRPMTSLPPQKLY